MPADPKPEVKMLREQVDYLLALVERWGIIHSIGNEDVGPEGKPYRRCRCCGVEARGRARMRHKSKCEVGAALAFTRFDELPARLRLVTTRSPHAR